MTVKDAFDRGLEWANKPLVILPHHARAHRPA
jgi:hypothetical protein